MGPHPEWSGRWTLTLHRPVEGSRCGPSSTDPVAQGMCRVPNAIFAAVARIVRMSVIEFYAPRSSATRASVAADGTIPKVIDKVCLSRRYTLNASARSSRCRWQRIKPR